MEPHGDVKTWAMTKYAHAPFPVTPLWQWPNFFPSKYPHGSTTIYFPNSSEQEDWVSLGVGNCPVIVSLACSGYLSSSAHINLGYLQDPSATRAFLEPTLSSIIKGAAHGWAAPRPSLQSEWESMAEVVRWWWCSRFCNFLLPLRAILLLAHGLASEPDGHNIW